MKTRWATCVSLLVALALGHKADRFPPGVPPVDVRNDAGIRFHEPTGTKQEVQAQPGAARKGPSKHVGGKHAFGGVKGKGIDLAHEKEHIKEHLDEAFIDLDDMNEVQLIATYFRNFDLDRNGRIDGLELLKTIFRMNDEHNDPEDAIPEDDIMDLVPELDAELEFYDTNNDGLITYPEFMLNHKKRLQG